MWGKTPTPVLITPRYAIAIPHKKLQFYTLQLITSFIHNDHNGYVNFSTNLIEKRLSYQNDRFVFMNLRLPGAVCIRYIPQVMTLQTLFIKSIPAWKMAIYD